MTNGQKVFIAIGIVAVYYLFIKKAHAATAVPALQTSTTPYLPTSSGSTPKPSSASPTLAQQQAQQDQVRAAEVAANQEQQQNQSMQDLGFLPGSGSAQ